MTFLLSKLERLETIFTTTGIETHLSDRPDLPSDVPPEPEWLSHGIIRLKLGWPVRKAGRNGKILKKYLTLHTDESNISWMDESRRGRRWQASFIWMHDVWEIRLGWKTGVWNAVRSYYKPMDEGTCFSVVMTSGRTTDVQMDSESDRALIVATLSHLVKRAMQEFKESVEYEMHVICTKADRDGNKSLCFREIRALLRSWQVIYCNHVQTL